VRRAAWLAVLMPLPALLAGCGDDAGSGTTLTVLAASSLQGAFTELGETFEDRHDGVVVRFAFAGSSDLAAQVEQGADADVFASADERTMDRLTGQDLVGEPLLFATNTLMAVVPPGNPAGIGPVSDLADDDLRLVVCAPQVPCGAAAVRLEEAAGVDLSPVSEEQNVTDVLNKVLSGEADAGLVYVTDVRAADDDVEGVDLPEAQDVVNYYPIAAVAGSEEARLAQQFVDLVTGDEGRRVLTDAGFGSP
jgi:molybdate transport system substrate-binding protein